MHFKPDAVPAEMEPLLRQFIAITGWPPWKARLESLQQQIKHNEFLGEYFAMRYPLEIEMGKTHRKLRRGEKFKLPTTYEQTALYSFVSMVARVHRCLSPEGQTRLAGMLRDGLKAEYGLAPLRHEMRLAAHFMGREFDVTFSDIEEGSAFDLLAERDGLEFEIEAKTHSGDLGRKIHHRRLYQLAGFVRPLMVQALDHRTGGQLVRLTVPTRLFCSDDQLREIYSRMAKVLDTGKSDPGPEPCAIDYMTFPLTGSPFESSHQESLVREAARSFLEQQVGFPVGSVIMLTTPDRSAFVLTVESAQKDEVTRSLVRPLKDSAKQQLTGTRPGVICVEFSDITEAEILELAERDRSGQPTALQLATNYLLNREDWRHIHTVAYFTPGQLVASRAVQNRTLIHSAQEQGGTYFFHNPNHNLFGDARISLF